LATIVEEVHVIIRVRRSQNIKIVPNV